MTVITDINVPDGFVRVGDHWEPDTDADLMGKTELLELYLDFVRGAQ